MIQNPLMIVTGFHSGDVARTKELFTWIKELGGCKPHCCLLVADASVDLSVQKEIAALAKESFSFTATIPNSIKAAWAPNAMFLSAAKWINDCVKMPWLWLESDCVPMREGWADSIMEEYEGSPMRFLGPIVRQTNQPTLPAAHLTGTAVYPQDAWLLYEKIEPLFKNITAWDIETAGKVVPRTKAAATIAHFYGEKDLAPTFVEAKTADSPRNAVTLDFVPKQAALYHRVKDGTLITLLRKQKKKK